ncbi:MAG: ACT domain-containing protein [bacterium]|nr:ACT domain-containing protein [bacterium]
MKEIVVVTQNRPGLLADLSEALGDRGINIETIDAEEVHDTAVVELTVDRYDEALHTLRDAGFDAVTEDALLIRLPDEPGSLAKVARRFKDASIDMKSVRIIRRQGGEAFVAIATDRTAEARALVKDYLAGSETE